MEEHTGQTFTVTLFFVCVSIMNFQRPLNLLTMWFYQEDWIVLLTPCPGLSPS